MELCEHCEFWISKQTGRANAKGNCYRYPEAIVKWSNDFCGEYKAAKPADNGDTPKRYELLKQCKKLGIPIIPKDTVITLLKKVKDYEKQEAEAANGKGEEEEAGTGASASGFPSNLQGKADSQGAEA